MDDKSIVRLFWQRREEAIAETAQKYGNYCYSIAESILHNKEDAEESVNDTYIEAWNCIPPHKPSVLSTFLGKLTRRISIDRYRQRTAQKRGGGETPVVLDELEECIPDTNGIESELEKKRLSSVMNKFVTALPPQEQKVFVCRYWYSDSITIIAEQFGFSESKVKSMLMRTRKKLKKILEKEGF